MTGLAWGSVGAAAVVDGGPATGGLWLWEIDVGLAGEGDSTVDGPPVLSAGCGAEAYGITG